MATVEKFKFWCNKILPLVYDDSLSYMEFLGKVYEKLNETIDAVNANTDAITEFDQRINDFIDAETEAREGWEDQQERDRQSWEGQQAQKWAAFQAMFIAEYDPSNVYVQGDLCSVQYKMYVANASTTGTFDPAKWDEIVLSDYLAGYVSTAAASMQTQYDNFLTNYQRQFGVVDGVGGSTTDAISQRAATALVHTGNLIDWKAPGVRTGGYYNYQDGHFTTNSTYNSSDFIPVMPGDIIYFYSPYDESTNVPPYHFTFWDASMQFVSGIRVEAGTELPYLTIPSTATIRFLKMPYRVDSIPTVITASFEPVSASQKYLITHKYDNDYVDYNFYQDVIAKSSGGDLINTEDPTIITSGYYNYHGEFNTSSTVMSSGKIPCKMGDRLYGVDVKNNINGWHRTSLTFWNSNDEFVTGIATTEGTEYYTVPLNSNIAYFRIPLGVESIKQNLCPVISYTKITPAQYFGLDTARNILVPEFWHWRGKVWYAYGTSITQRGDYTNPVAKFSNMLLTNKGIGGGGIGDLGAHSHGQVYNAICNITDGKLTADLITLETGANDCTDPVPLGTIYDTGRSTLAGCLNDCIRYLQTNTQAQIAVIASPATTSEPGSGVGIYYEWLMMIRDICFINNVLFIPNPSNLGYAKLTSSYGSLYVEDVIHQTDLGGYVYAENVWNYLKRLPTFKTELPT